VGAAVVALAQTDPRMHSLLPNLAAFETSVDNADLPDGFLSHWKTVAQGIIDSIENDHLKEIFNAQLGNEQVWLDTVNQHRLRAALGTLLPIGAGAYLNKFSPGVAAQLYRRTYLYHGFCLQP